MPEQSRFDVLVVGSGLMGAATAALLREQHPRLRIGMVEAGPPLGSRPGDHLDNVPEPELWAEYNAKVIAGHQGFYTGFGSNPGTEVDGGEAAPGMYDLATLGQDAAALPGAAVAWNVGGMGIHWTAATPSPWGTEVDPNLSPQQWSADLRAAADLLRVNPQPSPPTAAGRAVAATLSEFFDPFSAVGRGVQTMPMAVNRTVDPAACGLLERTGPATIFAPIADPASDPAFTLLPSSPATAIRHRDGRATGLRIRNLRTGGSRDLTADQVVVCADAIRTPQLLFASGIRPPALGRYLNEHFFVTGLVIADPERLGFDLVGLHPPTGRERVLDRLWVPQSGPQRPYQVYVMNALALDDAGAPQAYEVRYEIYVPTQIRPENRLVFSPDRTDAIGMPQISVHFGYTDTDRANLRAARRVQQQIGDLIGRFDPDEASAVLPPGSSLHLTGTVRCGAVDDGTSVCDTDGRVWGFENLYVAGNGVVPTALACNATLTGMTTAVRAARAVAADVSESVTRTRR